MTAISVVTLAWVIEILVGWPDALYRRIGHPVVWIGALIGWFDKWINRPSFGHKGRYVLGAVSSLAVLAVTVATAIIIERLLAPFTVGGVIEAVLASSLIASRSLYVHVAAVGLALKDPKTDQARRAVGHIVGRNPRSLNRPAIVRAAIESLAENTSDGVTAPLFWGVLFGLPGLAGYKAVNTLDSMIGHRTEKHGAFGGFAARLDDVMNWVPARLTGLLFAIVSFRWQSFSVMVRDAPRHRSPNAGWPEAAMAGALGIRLSGPRVYGQKKTCDPWLNDGAPDPTPKDLQAALGLYRWAMATCAMLLAIVACLLEGLI